MRKGLVFGVLVLALVWAYFSLAGPKKKESRLPRRTETIETVPAPRQKAPVVNHAPEGLYQEYETKPWGKNPFYGEPSPEPNWIPTKKVNLHLLGVLIRGYKAQALINDQMVTVGDELEGFTVTDISRDGVVLNNGKITITLRVTKESS